MNVAPNPSPPDPAAPRTGGKRVLFQQLGPLAVVALAVADFVRAREVADVGEGFRFAAMAGGASGAFVLLAAMLGLKLFRRAHPAWRILAWGCCALVALLALRATASHAFDAPQLFELAWVTRLAGSGGRLLSTQTAALLLITTFSFVALLSPLSARQRWRDGGIAAAVAVQVFAIVAAISYTAGNPPASTDGWLKIVPHELAGIVALNALLLLQARATNRLRQWFFGIDVGAEPEDLPMPPAENRVLALLAVAGLLALGASVSYLRVQTRRQQVQALEAIQTLSDLKARQVVTWRRDRLADAHAMAQLPLLAEAVAGAVDARGLATARTRLEPWLAALRANNFYASAVVLDRNLQPVASAPRTRIITLEANAQLAALRTATEVIEVPLYVDAAGALHWDLLVPLRTGAEAALQGAIWLQTAPDHHIMSQLGWWPDNYRTGQTVLWFRDGDRLTSLGGPQAVNAVTARQSQRLLSQLPAYSLLARAMRGEIKAAEGLDHRGRPILGTVNSIRNSSWFLTSRVDSQEVYATLRRDAWLVAGLLVGLLGTTGAATSWLVRQRQRNLVHERVAAELEQKRLATRLGMVMRHAHDMIFLVDENRRVVEANQQAVDTYGWTKEEFLRLTTKDLRAPEALPTFAADAKLADAPGGARYETVHRRKDGTTFPVEISVRQVELDGQRQVLSIIRDITDRRQAEAALRASEERYRLIADNTSDVIWLYDKTTDQFTYASPAALPLLGYRPEEVVGRRLLEFVAPVSHDAARRTLEQALRSAHSTRAPVHLVVELEHVRKDGSHVPAEVVTSVLSNASGQVTHILGVTRDITERRKARATLEKFNDELEEQVKTRTAELAARNREIEALVESIPDTVLLCDERGELITSHFAQNRGSSFPFANVSGAGLSEQHPVLLEIARELHTFAWASQQTVMLEFDRNINGADYSIEARATPAGENRLLILLRDISARKRVERVVQANLEREKQLSEMKSQFVSVASHEFRTPLAAATGSLELLERHAAKITEAKRLELLTRAQRSLGRLTTIMDNVLQLSRADSGRVKVKRMVVDLVQIVQDLIREVEAGDRQKHGFVFNPSGKGDAVPVDTNLFNHILSNLLGNAVRYSPADTAITVTLEMGEQAFTLTVADEGIGIPEAERDRVFEPFARGSNVGQIGGTGLGLNIVKRYTEMMGGRIELLPTERGAAFRINLPFQQA